MKIDITQDRIETGEAIFVSAVDKRLEIYVDEPLPLEVYDFAIWPLLLYAMYHNRSLEIDHPVSSDLIFQTDLFQSLLHRYLSLPKIEVRANRVAPINPTYKPRTLLPFSGGVDSTFSLLYNHFELNRKIDGVLIVRGLDIFEENEYLHCRERCQPILNLTASRVIPLRTNFRDHFVTKLGWKLHSDFVLSGLLHIFHANFGYAFISGDGDAGLLSVRECFKTPFLNERLFNHFSNDRLLIQNFEGPDFTKVEKIQYISKYREARENLRVCWKYRRHLNCGQCTKCVMTQLAFISVTGEIPSCFPQPATEQSVRAVLIIAKESNAVDPDSPSVILPKEFSRILKSANKHSVKHPYLDLLKNEHANLDLIYLVR